MGRRDIHNVLTSRTDRRVGSHVTKGYGRDVEPLIGVLGWTEYTLFGRVRKSGEFTVMHVIL